MAKLHIDIQGQAGVTEELTKEDISTLASCVDKVDDESDVRGSVHADVAYGQDVQKVRERFPDLELNVDVAGIHFEDPEVERILLASTAINPNKDEIITFEEAENVTGISVDMFYNNKLIEKFNEFRYFSKVKTTGFAVNPDRGNFQGCTALKEITLPDEFNAFGRNMFIGCSNLESVKCNNDKITSIGMLAFVYCSKLTMDIYFPNLTSLGQAPFYGARCKRVLSLGKVTNLPCWQGGGNGIFQGNTNLEYMHLPATLTRIEEQGFRSCSKLKIIVCDASVPPTFTSWMGYDGLSGLKYVFVPSGSIENSTDDDGNTVQGYKSKWGFASSKTYAIGGTEWQTVAQEEAEKESVDVSGMELSDANIFEYIYTHLPE